jgi:GT2 family glycosyltransferase
MNSYEHSINLPIKVNIKESVPTFAIVTSCFNKSHVILEHIKLLQKSFIQKHRIIIVDDKSTDKTKELVKSLNNIELIENDSNCGSGESNNRALNIINEDFVIFLDADFLIGSYGWIENWYFFQKLFQNIGESGELHYCSSLFKIPNIYNHLINQHWIRNVNNINSDILNSNSSFESTAHVGGSYKIFKTSLIKKIGGFSNHINPVCVEVEISIRVKSLGFEILPYRVPYRWISVKGDTSDIVIKESQRMESLIEEQKKEFEKSGSLFLNPLNWLGKQIFYGS